MSFVNGQGRKILINTVADILAGTVPASLDFGVHLASEIMGIMGLVRCDSVPDASARIEFRYQVASGTTMITSYVPVSSGGNMVNELNPAAYVGVAVSNIVSATAVRLFLTGQPIR